MEADLRRFYSVDYRDRWRGGLTLRQLSNLVQHLPPESATAALAREGLPYWSIEAHLLDDLRMVEVGTKKNPAKPHPLRPKPRRRNDPTKVAAHRRRTKARRDRIKRGEL